MAPATCCMKDITKIHDIYDKLLEKHNKKCVEDIKESLADITEKLNHMMMFFELQGASIS